MHRFEKSIMAIMKLELLNDTSQSLELAHLLSLDAWNIFVLLAVALLTIQFSSFIKDQFIGSVKAPFVGQRSIFEPGWWVRMRYMTESASMIQEGYRKTSPATYASSVASNPSGN